jgi:cellulose synthase/poly-beta-1,6-N-acetylglucosamine synthase-like glycosyltransferase
MELIFWISLLVLFYSYLGYGLILLLGRFIAGKKAVLDNGLLPAVTVIVPAFNEESMIDQKIQNCLSLQYPSDRLFFLFITDGSSDSTPQRVAAFPLIQHLHLPERSGKTAALNRAMQQVQTPVVVFTDANTLLHPDSIKKMVRHYVQEDVGGVSGEKRILSTDDTAVSTGEQIYWRYESLLKKADASFYTVVGAAGELFSIRTALFEPISENIILDDFVLSAKICLKGYRFVYEEEAWASEAPSQNIGEEQKRKVRISAGCFQALVLLKELLNPFRNWRLTFQYVSHRVLRWTVCPLLVPMLFFVSAALALQQPESVYYYLWLLQCLFYLLALVGWPLAEKKGLPRILFIPYYFVFMNLSLYMGLFRFMANKQPAIWNKAARKAISSQGGQQ